ncbi:MAG: hypothetical protein E7147_04700 [Rikenellaceae bacterium]|nr:hypothetical protein [Rikenellaceae bacterium]
MAKFFVAVAALFVGVSCTTDTTEDLGQQIVGKGQTVLTVSTGESVLDTKTSLGGKVDGTYPIYWSNGDQLSLNGVASAPLADVEANSTSATFTWEGTFDAPFCVAYPASEEGTVTFAAEQEYVEGTFSQNAVPMIGYSDEVGVSGVQLQYLAGVLQFNVSGAATLASMIIETVDGTPIAGVFDCDFAAGTVKPQAGSRSSIEYSFGEDGLDISGGKSFHVAVPAGKYDAVKVIMLEANGGAFEGTVKADGTVKPELAAGQVREFTISNWSANKTYKVIKDVDTLEQFAEAVAETPDLQAVVLKDVDASSIAATWAPIEGFTGLLRGNGKTISGLTKPLFGELKGTVTNLTYEANVAPGAAASATDASKNLAAIFANTTNGATLTSCTVKGSLTINNNVYVPTTTVKTGEFWFAGFAGKSTNSTFQNCTNKATITITQSMKATNKTTYVIVGGIVAHSVSGSAFVNCVNNGPINYNDAGAYVGKDSGGFGGTPQTNGYLGCIVGYIADADSYLDGCVNNAKFTHGGKSMRTFSAGGVIGGITTSTKGVSNCVNNGDIEANALYIYGNLGGIVGTSGSSITNCKNDGEIKVVPVKKSNKQYAYIAGVAANSSGTISGCENSGDIWIEGTIVAATSGSGYIRAGGISGNDTGTVSDCTNNGNITSKGVRGGIPSSASTINAIGGISGYKSTKPLSGCTNNGTITYDVTSYSTGEGFNEVNHIGGIVGCCSQPISSSHNTGDVILPATADVNSLAMGGIAGWGAAISDSDNKGKVQVLGKINGEPKGMHRVLIGGVSGRATSFSNTHNLEGGDVTVSGAIAPTSTAQTIYDSSSGWGSFGIGGVTGSGTGLTVNTSNAANLTVSSDIAAIPTTTTGEGDTAETTNNYTMHPLLIAGVTAYGGDADNENVVNRGTITVSGTHSYNTVGLYISGVYCRGCNGEGCTYTKYENYGPINVSVVLEDENPALKIAGIVSYSVKGYQVDYLNEGPINFTGSVVGKQLHIAGVSTGGGTASTTFTNCDNGTNGVITVNGNTGSDYDYLGGVFDSLTKTVTLTGCDNRAAITHKNTGTTTPYKTYFGGIVGHVSGKLKGVTKCSNSGKLTSNSRAKYMGGCFGQIDVATDLNLWTDITNLGEIVWPAGSSHVPYIGGVAGSISDATGVIKQWHNSGTINVCNNVTKVNNLRTFVGGLVGTSNIKTFSYCSNTGNVLAPYARRTTAGDDADLTTWVGLLCGTRYYHTGATGTNDPTTANVDNCLIKGTIKRYRTDKKGVDECVVDTIEEAYRYAFAEPGDMTTEEHNPLNYFTNISVTTMPQEPSTEDTTPEDTTPEE